MEIKIVEPWLPYNERKKPLTGIILHHTAGGTAESSIDYMRSLQSPNRASYHYIVDRDGTVFKCVPVSKRAWHAGSSVGKYGDDVNSQTVGISFANLGNGEAYPSVQVQAAHDLVDTLCRAQPGIEWISTHRLITDRKIDPASFGFRQFCSQHPRLEMWMDASLNRGWDG